MFGSGMITVLFAATSHDVTECHLSVFFPLIIVSVLQFFDYRLNKLIRFFGGWGCCKVWPRTPPGPLWEVQHVPLKTAPDDCRFNI